VRQAFDILTFIPFDERHVLLLQHVVRTKAVVYCYRAALNKARKDLVPVMVAYRLAKEADNCFCASVNVSMVNSINKGVHSPRENSPTGKKGHRDTGGHRLVLQQKTVISQLLHSVTRE
jgi:hypothetical protein